MTSLNPPSDRLVTVFAVVVAAFCVVVSVLAAYVVVGGDRALLAHV